MVIYNKMRNPNRKTATQVLAIYSKKTGALRRVIDADHDHEYVLHEQITHPGEGFIYVPHSVYDDYINFPFRFHDYVAQQVGFEGRPHHSTTRHAHINEHGEVINIIEADISCGDDGEHLGKGHKIIQHPKVEIGHHYKNGKFEEVDD